VPLSEDEWILLERACAAVPPPAVLPTPLDYPDYPRNLVLTVLDLRLRRAIVNKALDHYDAHRRAEIRDLDDLDAVLAGYVDDRSGNRAAAKHLWGNNYAARVRTLRLFVRWVRLRGLTDRESLHGWARSSTFSKDFDRQVKGLGINAYQWLMDAYGGRHGQAGRVAAPLHPPGARPRSG